MIELSPPVAQWLMDLLASELQVTESGLATFAEVGAFLKKALPSTQQDFRFLLLKQCHAILQHREAGSTMSSAKAALSNAKVVVQDDS
jgi:hypothetical protein